MKEVIVFMKTEVVNEPKLYGYARVSTFQQKEDRQIIALKSIGVLDKNIYVGRLQVQIEQDLSSNYISGIHLIKKSVEQFIRSVVA